MFEKTDSLFAEEGEAELPEDQLFSSMPEYSFEMDRHRIIVALIISDFFLFLLKHFKANHIVQFMYLTALLVDANGVLVLLKFQNQGSRKIDFDKKLDTKCFFLKCNEANNLYSTVEFSINSSLKLLYKTCKN